MQIRRLTGIAVSIAIPAFATSSHAQETIAVPQALWAAQINPFTLTFTWNAVPGAASYRVYCGVRGQPEQLLGTMTSGQLTTYANGVPRRVSYAKPLRPTDYGSEHRCSVEWGTIRGEFHGRTSFNPVTPVLSSTTKGGSPAPAFATATSTSENEITLTWAPVPGATAYTINREVAPLGFNPFCDVCSTTSTSIVDRFTEKSRKHRYFIIPITAAGAGPRATSNYVVPGVPPDTTPIAPGTPLASPATVTATVVTSMSAKASWIAVRGPVAYEVSRYAGAAKTPRIVRIPNDLAGVLIEFPDKLSIETSNGTTPVTVRYSVRSVDGRGSFAAPVTSNTINVASKEAGAIGIASQNVTNARATTMSASSIMLTWTPPTGSYTCDLERSLSSGAFTLLGRLPTGAYRYIDEMADLAARSPRYRIRCGSGKMWLPTVAFPSPAPAA